MAESALFIRWGQSFPGREEIGLGVFMNAVQFFTNQKDKKNVENFSVYVANEGNITEQQGAMIIEGSFDQVNKLRNTEEYQTLLTKAAHVVPNLVVTSADTGPRVMQRIEKLQVIRKELGITK